MGFRPEAVLEGIRVIDFGIAGVGPITGHVLADFGAEVIKVESATRLDMLRRTEPFKDNIREPDRAIVFGRYNQNKLSVTLNLRHPKAIEVTKALVKVSDIVMENWTPGAMDKLGLGYEQLSKVKPDIIMISMSFAGQSGPYQFYRGHGPVLQAMIGINEFCGWPEGAPATPAGAVTDHYLPNVWVMGILASLDYRLRTGKGQYIDASDFEAGMDLLDTACVDFFANGRIQTRRGNRHPNAAPHGVFRCAGDDQWCAIAVFTQEEWHRFCAAVGDPAWTQRKEFFGLSDRLKHVDELEALVEQWTISHSPEQVTDILQKAGVAAAKVLTSQDLYNDPQLKHRQHFWERGAETKEGAFTYEAHPCILSKTPATLRRGFPHLGEHNFHVFGELLGMGDDEIVQLMQDGVIN